MRTKTFSGLAVALCLCLAGCLGLAVITTFWDRGASDLSIRDAALPTAAPDGGAAPSGAATSGTSFDDPATAAGSPTAIARQRAAAARSATPGASAASRAGSGGAHHPTLPVTRPPRSIPASGGGTARVASAKKGAALWKEAAITQALADSGVSWFYTWSADTGGIRAPKGVQFVPMIWGASSVNPRTLATAKRNGSVLLGFNEPDFASQSNVSVSKALELWPQLQATGMRLGSPAVAWGADRPGAWLDRFMTGAQQRGYRVDFITLHWYGGDFRSTAAVQQLKSYIQATYARYHKPIWVTEYALMNFSGGPKLPSASVQADFVTASAAMLQSLPYVERYSWFAFPTSTDGTDGTGLYRPGAVPTTLGRAYRAAG
jgi:Glycosyl hydrolase catalytic core